MEPAWDNSLQGAAVHRDRHQRARTRRALSQGPGMTVSDGSQAWINFSANDYLGLAGHPELARAMALSAGQGGVGSGASALITGYHPAHQGLEEELADFLGYEKALVCSSGYLANLAVATSLAGRGDCIIQDRLCHASLIDAARLSGARLLRYPHGDSSAIERRLNAATGKTLLVSDGVFSMDGDVAPLEDMARLANTHGALLVVDDAHGIGVTGPQGRGSVAAAGLGAADVPVLVGTLGKAFGCAGAFIAAGADLIEHLVNEARSYIFTTSMPPAIAVAASAALLRVREDKWRRAKLAGLVAQFRNGAQARGIELLHSQSPIQPLVIGGSAQALAAAAALRDRGFLVAPIRPPTVPAGSSRLRVTLSAGHEAEQVDALLKALEQCLQAA